MRVLVTVDAVGGVWQYATDLARALADQGVEAILALTGPAPSADQLQGVELVETGVALDWLAPDAQAVTDAGRRIAELAWDLRADVVQLNAPALAASAQFAMPVVAVAHSCLATWWEASIGGALPFDFAWRDRMTGVGLRAADRVVAPSASFAAATMATHRLTTAPQVVHNGRYPLHTEGGAVHDFAFSAGRLWDQGKNVATLDRVAARLTVPFKVAGPLSGPHGETISFAHLHALGNLTEAQLAACLSSRPVFVSAATYEPFGLAVLEAAMAGCPLVLSDIPTFRELWSEAAIFVSADDDRGFAAAISALIHDESARLARGEAARRAAARFTPAAMATGMARIYRELAAPNARVAA